MFRKVEISHKTILFTVVVVLSLGLLFMLKELILQLFVAALITVVLNPMVAKMSQYKVPRALSVLLTYILVVGTLVGVFWLIVPTIIEQSTGFIEALPGYLMKLGVSSDQTSQILQGYLNSNAGTASGAIFQFTYSIVNNIVSILTVLVFAFYMLMAHDKFDDQLGLFFGEEKKKEFGSFLGTLEKRLSDWARGQFLLMFTIGLVSYIGLTLLAIPYALPLALLAGLFEIVPFLGPIISAIPAVIIGFGIAPITGIGVAALVFLIQQLENYVLVPKVMEKSAGVSPLITLIALAVGAKLAGVVGAIISVPVVIILQVVAKRYLVKD